MFPPAAKSAKAGIHRPVFRVCYLCGQQFGSASIGIHIPQCYQKKLSQWEKSDSGIRGPKPRHPDTVNWKGGTGASADQVNGEQYETFNSNLVPCPNCGRTFLPDRLPVHLRGCKGGGGGGASSPAARNGKPTASTTTTREAAKNTARSPSSARRSLSSGPPLLPTCYLCGQQFGTASIRIHVPQCYEKKLAQWKNADPRTRGQPPKNPDSVNWRGRPDSTAKEQATEQFREFMSNLSPCPNCGRKFLPDRLAVHLRSCRPGSTAKPLPTRSPPTAAAAADLSPTRARTEKRIAGAEEANDDVGTVSEVAQPAADAVPTQVNEDRLDPKRNRLSRTSPVPMEGRACPQCDAVEYDGDAKFCRECGGTLDASRLPVPCVHCGERIPQGSRFCGTCGQPVNGASAEERTPGGTNENVSTVRVVVCPACKAVCDADGNFCDNCGAALGDTDIAPTPQKAAKARPTASPVRKGEATAPTASSRQSGAATKFCPTCKTPVADMAATFCEDCGSRLETVEVPATADGGPPSAANSTLPPDAVARFSASPRKAPSPSSSRNNDGDSQKVPKTTTSPARAQPAPQAAASTAVHTSPPAEDAPEAVEDAARDTERLPCSHCGRRFAPTPLARHEKFCATQKNRRVFNAAKQRQPDDALPAASNTNKKQTAAAASAAVAVPKHDWKSESEAFRRALREARQVDRVLKSGGTAKDLPPPTYSTNPDYVQCPHCQRRFAAEVARRHIPHCANTVNRPKPPPRRR
ncbi:hypothetical protein ABB37_06063 [Leptomonas pyrrhocoris]|uniref:C2HC/C3H-type domain-containing protein n=1 Tax=Leptomonas pyrrhocoris TaxID=157538 RepID=A0A0M9FY24_LEPPY|nr:hypothetical protein ABB37_06063 [Leptomonas pyrrhocoris]KPA78435.1 hypothetical protein ABB37_06063 [Leptomonas pyrrhocoris]|eukprot:XP_015656874.1 hypothetical protein ABB37_06063 [Leptomonas pyrrhocoris]